jgi:transposase-like protein
MEDYPKSLLEFEERFSSEEACREYLFQLRWPEGFHCPSCQGTAYWETHRGLYKCRTCGSQRSVTAGTIFHRSRKPLRLWFRAMWHLTSQKYGANALGLQRILGFGSYHTAWEWLHKLRRAMVRPGRERLSGVIEVDETYVGGEKSGKRGRGAEGKCLVGVAVEDTGTGTKPGIGRIRLQRLPDASAPSLNAFLERYIEQGSTVRTDGWKGYEHVAAHGYAHLITRQSAHVGDSELYVCHKVISLFKRWLLGTYQGAVSPEHLDYYLDEYTFRFNRRTSRSRGKLFYRLVQQAVLVEPISGKQIEGGKPPHQYNI